MQRSKIILVVLTVMMLIACTEPNGAPGRGVENGGALNKTDIGTAAGAIGGGIIGYAHDYPDHDDGVHHRSFTYEDCVHGSMGNYANLDCTRNRADRSTDDTDPYNTDTGVFNGSRQVSHSY